MVPSYLPTGRQRLGSEYQKFRIYLRNGVLPNIAGEPAGKKLGGLRHILWFMAGFWPAGYPPRWLYSGRNFKGLIYGKIRY